MSDDISRIVVMGIWGRAGGNGIPALLNKIKPRLVNFGVPSDHIFSTSWNPAENDNPFGMPDTYTHKNEINAREASPSYVALIGHSYGGWAACQLSQVLERRPNFVGLIDPVFGPRGDIEKIVQPQGFNIHNWYQRNSILEPILDDCSGRSLGCGFEIEGLEGLSCGRPIDIPGINNHEVRWQRDWDGNQQMRDCMFFDKPRHSYHVTIDSDRFVWRQIIEQIEADIAVF